MTHIYKLTDLNGVFFFPFRNAVFLTKKGQLKYNALNTGHENKKSGPTTLNTISITDTIASINSLCHRVPTPFPSCKEQFPLKKY